MQKWHVELTKTEFKKIKKVLRSKKISMEAKKRAQILEDIDESNGKTPLSLRQVTVKRGVCANTVIAVRRNYAEEGIDMAILRKKRETPPVEPKITGEVEAHIIATACSKPPEGKSEWTLKMIASKIVLDGVIENISSESVRLV
jgi:Mrp family chromosome partitioning ATPase